jgi:exopolyphosphatase/guanosine-5'-triphosphate,3'-diphosphate pyrophosphatase
MRRRRIIRSTGNGYGSSGTIRTIADIIARNKLGDGLLTSASLDALARRFIELGHTSRIDMPGLRPDRASTIVGGLAILIGLFRELDIPVMTPIEAGLRMGVMWDLYLRSTKRDRREQSVQGCMDKFHIDQQRAGRVAEQALAMYAQLKPTSEALVKCLR